MASSPKYRPFLNAAADFEIGLKPSDPENWLDVSADYAVLMPVKRRRLAEERERCYRALPRSLAAQHELFSAVTAHLLAHHSAAFRFANGALVSATDGSAHPLDGEDEPLMRMSCFIEEDFVILEEEGGRMMMTAAANPYTSSGRIIASVGGHLPWAHGPVPRLNEKLGARIDRILMNVRDGVPAERFNWFITAIGDVYFPPEAHDANVAASIRLAGELAEAPEACGARLFLRVERQTLRRLPHSGAVAFGIHTYSDPLSCISGDTESLIGLKAALEGFGEERLAYAAMTTLRDPLLRWIEASLAQPSRLASSPGVPPPAAAI